MFSIKYCLSSFIIVDSNILTVTAEKIKFYKKTPVAVPKEQTGVWHNWLISLVQAVLSEIVLASLTSAIINNAAEKRIVNISISLLLITAIIYK